jgi:hypothetical protein
MSVVVTLQQMNVDADEIYNFEFLCRETLTSYLIHISFKSVWQHEPFVAGDELFINDEFLPQSQQLLSGMWISDKNDKFWMKKNALASLEAFECTLFLSFPNDMVRQIFFSTFKSWSEKTNCPAEVQYINTVGYPTIALHFQHQIISQEMILSVTNQIIQAIAHLEVVPFTEEKEVAPEEIDVFENAEVIEMELEPELQEQVDKIRDKDYIPPLFPEGTESIEEAATTDTIMMEVSAWGTEDFLSKATLTTAYALKANGEIPLEALWANYARSLKGLDDIWIEENFDKATRFAFATEVLVIRHALGELVEAIEDEEVLRRHGNLLNFMSTIDVTNARIIDVDEKLGTLYIFPRKVDRA